MQRSYSEDSLVEQPAIELFKELGWEVANCYKESFGSTLNEPLSSTLTQPSPSGRGKIGEISLGRETAAEVVLISGLRPALERLNPDLPAEAITIAIEALTRDRSAMSSTEANRQIYKLLKDGVRADLTGIQASSSYAPSGSAPSSSAPSFEPSPKGRGGNEESVVRVKVIDWDNPKNNDFFLASQFWVIGDTYKRRADLIGFVNGLPMVFIELKKLRTEDAFHHNLRDYKNTVPKLFWYNAFIILSHGSKSLIGSLTADLDHFVEWKKINDEGDEGIVSLDTMIRGTCEPARLLDLVENFTLFIESPQGLLKLIAKNHQYLGVNRAIDALRALRPMLRGLSTLTPDPSPKGRGEKDEEGVDWGRDATTPSGFTPSPQPSPKGRGGKNANSERAEFKVRGSQKRQYRGGYQFAGLVDRARELRKKGTPAEALLWELLRNRQFLGFKFRRQHQFGDYTADFYCHEAQLVVECDGPVHEPNEQWHHDQNRDAYMIAQGLRILRFSNDRILDDTENVLDEIAAFLPSPGGRGVGGEGLVPATV